MSESMPQGLYQKCRKHPKLGCYIHIHYPHTFFEAFKRYVFPGPGVAFIRIVLALVCFIMHYIMQRIVYIGYKDWDNPAPKWRRRCSQMVYFIWGRLLMISFGFYHITVIDHTKNRPLSNNPADLPRYVVDQPYPLIGPHMSLLDVFFLSAYFGLPSIMAKDSVASAPYVSFMMKIMRGLVQYRDPELKKTHPSATEVLRQRIESPVKGEYTPLVFAEGTTNNGTCLTRFRKGAFLSGKPVRPFILCYPHKHCCLNWDTNSVFDMIYSMLTQFYNNFRLEILDVYNPSIEEQHDAQLYASNVGKMIAEKMGLPYRPDVDLREKLIILRLVGRKITWEQAQKELADSEKQKEKEMQDYQSTFHSD
ncbi:putative lysophosphatidylcholine acyltransferase / lyso-PAF acetyltransferase [Monocercomonoides exilis]|uniref:putative lysophosphatidylcholine acyltransferase / lyso-PAF acetyltransferase n=1 Tax=Monocercomonoides exilis TaxID=2049356 RepID=UPI0035597D58|nr:putative lysophosphatidylcholine acyltransferase / lyso-PAF acetyltransferase [Monocercomonoides exilis]|eukprot:MONOS_6412.1-p1 / transcript=MONOS_6412.1 / gene=MONOS_6412 / organism=Monocercomonoides_exilis_PA203 / gene_product=lysophosphatidylcholine acyltransferase / lyso-PAF acetyltransferase [EC:2.3.1.23 2.3.1.67] / transcript_product=lysophosphatidylcholine acyltransferase / lyso-PAF acetyltransferase [EC:2.3.1.23 2.3.1.67] / location=Mono_scaffold00201:89863-91158(+) / protein_length=364 / sequence_SO=supercontig / SO=protein_coding / is_pseudo=false